MKVSFITTVLNEEDNIVKLLDSLFVQTDMPDEIIIVDGGSSDRTIAKIENQKTKLKKYKGKFLTIIKNGNRSIGRNESVEKATGDIIVCSDSGCILDRSWIKEIVQPFQNNNMDVVAGYYKGYARNIFQKCLIPYVLVMPDRLDQNNFLPAARSLAFRRTVWEKVGRFPEKYSHNEDFVFANNLKKMKFNIFFSKRAIVYWLPRENLIEAFNMFFLFAKGDAEARILRPKVGFIFLRYNIGILLMYFAIIRDSYALLVGLILLLILYITWSVIKNYKYVNDFRALIILPVLQITSDIAVMSGTIFGLLKYGI